MIILTCANSDLAKGPDGKIYKGFSFKGVIQKTAAKAKECGYTPMIYDLGSLCLGEPFPIDNVTSNAVFKPLVIDHCINQHNDTIVYIDADAQLCDSIDEILESDYDIGITLREASEIDNEWHRRHFDWIGFINAGVMILRPTAATKSFVKIWRTETEKIGDDQKALNKLACPKEYPEPESIATINGVKFKYFPCRYYNYYYFDEWWSDNIKVMHFKGNVRHFYPFTWRKKLYCMRIVPILTKTKSFVKSLIKCFLNL